MPQVAGVSRGPSRQAQQVRKDPPPRSLDGVALQGIAREDPDRFYAWVGTGEQMELYESMGYEVERRTKEGVTDVGVGTKKRAVGSPITRYDTVLMSIPKSLKAQLEDKGPDGESGQSLTSKVERRIFNRRKQPIPEVTRGLDVIGHSSGEPTMTAETIPTPFGEENG